MGAKATGHFIFHGEIISHVKKNNQAFIIKRVIWVKFTHYIQFPKCNE